jgi:hypothetical protein
MHPHGASDLETDYLIVGAGAAGLAFADTLLQRTDAHITLVDKHAQPGGHWNDAYPFVTLHQPSAFYGVNSLELGTRRKDTSGPNAGYYELASGAEVTGYFHRVMHQQLLPSGRVRYLPMTEFLALQDGVAHVRSLLSGAQSAVHVRRKLVDSSYYSPNVPATCKPRYDVAADARLVTPTQLTQLWMDTAERPTHFCILGAGKTAMDVGVWLLNSGAPPEAIHWVVPRDSWVVNRATTQPGTEFFEQSIGGQVQQMKALAEARSVEDLFLRLEAAGQMLRIDRARLPGMFHYATLSEGEVQCLRQITQVIRKGRVQAVTAQGLRLAQGDEALPRGTLTIDCTASAVEPRPTVPIFQPGKVVPQLLRVPLVTLSAALCAYVEAQPGDDAQKNQLCTPVPFPRNPGGFVQATLVSLGNQVRFSQDKAMRQWMRDSRLDGFGKMTSEVDPGDTPRLALLAELRQQGMAAMANGPKLMAAALAARPH